MSSLGYRSARGGFCDDAVRAVAMTVPEMQQHAWVWAQSRDDRNYSWGGADKQLARHGHMYVFNYIRQKKNKEKKLTYCRQVKTSREQRRIVVYGVEYHCCSGVYTSRLYCDLTFACG